MQCQEYYFRELIEHFAFYTGEKGTAESLLNWLHYSVGVYQEGHSVNFLQYISTSRNHISEFSSLN